ncbi:MAG: GRAM domain-containing protein, partial [Cytophagales bacterium]|nr:GRAM domain-containing protein [Cytophagales bacterium]
EVIQREGPANLFRGIEAVGGKLLLTNKRLVFKSHKVNIQRGQINLELDQVTGVTSRKTSKIFDNGMRILNKNGEPFDFVVFERDEWISRIKKSTNTLLE